MTDQPTTPANPLVAELRAQRADYVDRMGKLSEDHDVHRKALAQAVDMTLDRNWEQLIEGAARLNEAASEWMSEAEAAKQERDQYASAIRQLIVQVKQTAHAWVTTLPDSIATADVAKALMGLCSPLPDREDLRDDLWQRIVAAYYLRFENDGHPEDSKAAADEAMAIIRPELEQLRADLNRVQQAACRTAQDLRTAETELQQWRDTYGTAQLRGPIDRLQQAEAAIERVRDLHERRDNGAGPYCYLCADSGDMDWPCATIRAIDEQPPTTTEAS